MASNQGLKTTKTRSSWIYSHVAFNGEHLVKDGFDGHPFVGKLPGRRGLVHARLVHISGQPEVRDFQLPVVVQENVASGQVSVDELPFCQVLLSGDTRSGVGLG